MSQCRKCWTSLLVSGEKRAKLKKSYVNLRSTWKNLFFYTNNVILIWADSLNVVRGIYWDGKSVQRQHNLCCYGFCPPPKKKMCTHNTHRLNGKSRNLDTPRKITRCKPQVILSRGTLDFSGTQHTKIRKGMFHAFLVLSRSLVKSSSSS